MRAADKNATGTKKCLMKLPFYLFHLRISLGPNLFTLKKKKFLKESLKLSTARHRGCQLKCVWQHHWKVWILKEPSKNLHWSSVYSRKNIEEKIWKKGEIKGERINRSICVLWNTRQHINRIIIIWVTICNNITRTFAGQRQYGITCPLPEDFYGFCVFTFTSGKKQTGR